jgi:ribosome-associated protein
MEKKTLKSRKELSSKQIAVIAQKALSQKKGFDTISLDLRGLSDIADFFVLVSGSSDRHVRTLAEAVIEALKLKGAHPLHVDGSHESTWIVVDYGAVIVHAFHKERRSFYSLERLWGEAKVVKKPKRIKKNERTA